MFEILKNNKKIIINSDIDGILSGLLLHHFCNCKIVGFSNSKDKIWLDRSKCDTIFDAVYIDIFVSHKNVATIDQHIISYNQEHHNLLVYNVNKINPNLDNPRFLDPTSSYVKKYPFGTCHYILAHLIKEKLYDDAIDFNKITSDIKAIDLFLRADDAMQTTKINYPENAAEWWKWLEKLSEETGFFYRIPNYIGKLTKSECEIKKKQIETIFKERFNCDSPDGGMKEIATSDGSIKNSVKHYIQFVSEMMNLNLFDLEMKLECFIGKNKRITLSQIQRNELILYNKIDGEDCFSYAFINKNTISYTVLK